MLLAQPPRSCAAARAGCCICGTSYAFPQ
jgi:hypothetical protein